MRAWDQGIYQKMKKRNEMHSGVYYVACCAPSILVILFANSPTPYNCGAQQFVNGDTQLCILEASALFYIQLQNALNKI